MTTTTLSITRPDGDIAVRSRGEGTLLVAVPGMGDTASSFDGIADHLVPLGYRVVALDLRGHGDSDTTFHAHGDQPTADDLIAVIEHFGGPAVVLANSLGGAAAVLAAAARPDLVAAFAFFGPLLRNPASTPAKERVNRLLFSLAFRRPWGAALWAGMYRSMFGAGERPPAFLTHVDEVRRAFARPGTIRSLRELAQQLDHAAAEVALADVRVPALVVVGSLDPDYADPAAELAWMGERLAARTVLVDGVGHYPHLQAPERVLSELTGFLADHAPAHA